MIGLPRTTDYRRPAPPPADPDADAALGALIAQFVGGHRPGTGGRRGRVEVVEHSHAQTRTVAVDEPGEFTGDVRSASVIRVASAVAERAMTVSFVHDDIGRNRFVRGTLVCHR